MKTTEDFKDVLNKNGLKYTKQRELVLEVIEKSGKPVTAEQIFLKLENIDRTVNLSTVYRTLSILTGKGLIIKTDFEEDNKSLYEINHMEHKHYAVCLGCKKMFSLDDCPFEEYEKKIEDKTGFNVVGHKLEIFGYCENCKSHKN